MVLHRAFRSAQVFGATFVFSAMVLSSPAGAQQGQPPYGQPPYGQPPYGQQPYPAAPPPYAGQAPVFYPEQLDNMVSRIALYPDPLLAQILTAATFPDQVQQAAGWANAHRYLTGDALAAAIDQDRLPWDPSVLALIPFPTVLDMMARDPGWTQQLGSAVLAQRPQVMDAVQRMRQRAYDYGYLRDTPQERVVFAPGDIEIVPVNPGYYYVPYYNPAVVFVRPGRGIAIGAAISFGPRIFVGPAFVHYGWAGPRLDWRAHSVIIDNRPWQRTWVNRGNYVHTYSAPPRRYEERRAVEHHEREVREHERHDSRDGHDRKRDR